MPWRSRCLCIGYRAVPWCPLSSSKLPDTYAIHLHLHLHLLILLVILSSRHSSVYYYYTPSLPPLVPNRSTDIWTLPLADITAAVLLDKPILRPRHQPLNTSLDIYLRDKTINRHRLDNHHQQQLTQLNSTQLNSTNTTITTTTTNILANMKKSPLTPSTIPPPSINRQHSYTSHSTSNRTSSTPMSPRPASTDPRNILSQVASRAASPRRTNSSPSGSPYGYNSSSPPGPESPTLLSSSTTMERRRSWEDCVHQRDGYISFPDFDQVHASASGR